MLDSYRSVEFLTIQVCLRHRVSQLETELKQVRQKESEDTAALEKIIQQVETRLQATTVGASLNYRPVLMETVEVQLAIQNRLAILRSALQ